jgi:glycosyltransferase involved in cell wall biosynthesis
VITSVDIVVICKNDLNGLKSTVDSILSQSFSYFKVHIIDGMSDDGSLEYLSSISNDNVSHISENDDGIYHAMNKGLDQCTLDFVLFLNAGDTFYDNSSLVTSIDLITDKNKVYFGRTEIMAGEKSVRWLPSLNEIDTKAWLSKNLPPHPSIFFPKRFYSKNRYDLYLSVASDNDYKIRAITQCGSEFIDVNVAKFYLGGISSRSDFNGLRTRLRERFILNIKYSKRNIALEYFKILLIFVFKLVTKR